ncbi:UDP-N-acetylmuramoyl-L-alanyl-D-glutamate--2,6-diaminopimelate ligase [Paucibacter sp. XJ19-41]|uniref:UDP-N-acetylmuramoyl-L-alanyl-D-glutamate--2, 6-diaminopimelate ligase n=1 Tax=Paucibacter sp. XJ19-41 TaxID=2927824 RepID=UPI00234BD9DB|nr:UDP-N-acetylmuramoyl-L-alanyl-D-glutamate--2,6-diaminopimelate ligase [Paucibacter sp. XJ19-41]MDC6166745.1 UDP-N-acetylmuramoyl-L-alanyl-D-glutamate--2,6-diaminopimelate ligase [Paucibacter sp. XJ19-41]
MPITRLKSPEAAARWLREWTTGQLRSDSRLVAPGDAFIAWPGYAQDGRAHVRAALAAGAATCLVEAEGVEAFGFNDARVAALPGLKACTGRIAAEYFEHPSEAGLQVIASTGTNGKTSTAWWVAQILGALGRRCGVVGTLGIGEPPLGAAPGHIVNTGLTTPDPVQLQAGFRRMLDAGFAACAIEASSIGLNEQRLAGTRIAVALFTNFTQDHLDYHGTMAAYWEAKRALFDWPGLRAAVLNLDDPKGGELAAALTNKLDVWTYAVNGPARLSAHGLHYRDGGLAFELHEGQQVLTVQTGLIGDYNVANLLAVIASLRALGLDLADIVGAVPQISPVPGRMQRVGDGLGRPQAVVDYAHTPDALDKALSALRPLAAARGGRLIAVFGCGGNRDPGKRPLMGAIAGRLADAVVLTSDNPRKEPPAQILAQIAEGLSGVAHQVVEDRRAAIAAAIGQADARDVVLIAGKGHEDYQEIAGARQPFSDVAEAQQAQARWTGEQP